MTRRDAGAAPRSSASSPVVRRRIVFTGSVQGVGFRYRAVHAAAHWDCTGWVRNEYDGSVTMEIQGRADAIDQVVETISRGTFVHIEGMEVTAIAADPSERGFDAR